MSSYPDSVHPIFGLLVSQIFSVLTNVKMARWVTDKINILQKCSLTLVGLTLITRLVRDIYLIYLGVLVIEFGPFCCLLILGAGYRIILACICP